MTAQEAPALRPAILAALESGPLTSYELLRKVGDSIQPQLVPRRKHAPPPHPSVVLASELLRMAMDARLIHCSGGKWHLGRRPA